MKKVFFTLILLMASVTLFAQVKTVITGKVPNNPNKPVILLVYNFDTGQMREVEIRTDSIINSDHTFSFSTDEIRRPFTRCRIGFSNEGQEIRLSPGDTLQMEFEYGSMAKTTLFNGKSAGINNYLKLYNLRFNEMPAREVYDNLNGLDTQRINNLSALRNEKVILLDSCYQQAAIDSVYYRFEKSRIDYEYFQHLINPWINASYKDSLYHEKVEKILGHNNFSNDNALVDYREYRDFIEDYVTWRAYAFLPDRVILQDRIDQVSMQLKGLSKTYGEWKLMNGAIQNAGDSRQKVLLKKYFTEKSEDPGLLLLLDSINVRQSFRNGMDYRRMIQPTLTVLAFLLLLFMLIFIVYKNHLHFIKSGRQLNYKLFAINGLLLIILVFAFNYLRYHTHQNDGIFPFLEVVTMIGFGSLLVFWLIPAWFDQRKYSGFSLGLIIATSVYFAVILLIHPSGYDHFYGSSLFRPGSLTFILNSLVVLFPLSFLSYYLLRLNREKKSLGYLFSKEYLNPEFFIHLLIFCFLLSSPVRRMILGQQNLKFVFYLTLIAGLFYTNAFYLAPKYLIRGKFGKYLLISFFVLLGTLLVVYLKNVLDIYSAIVRDGIRIPLFWAFMQPRSQDVYAALVIQIVIVLALIYAFVRYQIAQKSLGFNLFRNKEAELNQLRSQVNPHFLFNSLNTVYAFALKENNPKTAEYIAKLANLMRYLVDDMEKEKIPVQKEISYIRDYINLQAIRSSVEHRIEINNSIDEEQSIMIAPMLMIPFVENAFKHGINPNSASELNVTFQIKDRRFQFVIENSIDKNFEAFYKEKGFGIGIPNVRQRLEYLYPGKHTLSIAETGDRFIVILNLDIVEPEKLARG
ncbi:MAG: histidine kinase [Bacteroidales bacterium]|jgi:hypothetical protein